MTQKSVKNQIIESYTSATPNCIDQIKRACEGVEQKDYDIYMSRDNNRINRLLSKLIIAGACLILVLISGIVYSQFTKENNIDNSLQQQIAVNVDQVNEVVVGMQAAIIYLDINPSIEIQIDEDMKVIDCVAINEDAKVIVDGLDLKGVEFKTAVDSIVGSLTVKGYLKDETDAILVSVNTNVDGLYENINKSVNVSINEKSLKCDVITQVVGHDSHIEQLAKEYNISEGKIVFVEKIIDESVDFTEENVKDLVQYPVKYLNDLLKEIYKKKESAQSTTSAATIETVVDDILNETDKVVDDSLNGADKIIDDSLKGVDKIVDDSLDLTDKIVDDAFDTTEKIITDVIGTETPINDILDDTHKIVGDTLDNAGKIFDKVIKKP